MGDFLSYIVLPREQTPFEASYVAKLNRIALFFFGLHVPALMIIAGFNRTKPFLAGALGLAVLFGPFISHFMMKNPRSTSVVCGIAAMSFGALLVHFGQGPMQIEMHFYFFALIAMLAVFGNPLVIIAAALTVATHHLALWFLVPVSVFNYDAPVWVVAVHTAFVLLESIAAVYIARSFFDNVIGLERIVKTRTAELDERNRDMRLVLDTVEQALATVDINGALAAERSATWRRWFGADARTIHEAFATRSPQFATDLELAWDQLRQGVLPPELLFDQLPKSLTTGKSHYAVAYTPIAGTSERYLIVVTDVTNEVSRAIAESESRETMHVVERILADRASVAEFFDEAAVLVGSIHSESEDLVSLKRHIHTLKGMCAIFGLETIARLCHGLESKIADSGSVPPEADLVSLSTRWEKLAAAFESFVGPRGRGRMIEMTAEEHRSLEEEAKHVSTPLFRRVRALAFEPTRSRLTSFADHAREIAESLDKVVDVAVDDGNVRLPREWAPFWSAFVHGVRNAIDHGIETPAERIASGKSGRGTIVLRTATEEGNLVIEIRDDGRGIDWDGVRERATLAGIAAGSPRDLQAALFHDGLSTRDEVTHTSGRGVGMGALRAMTLARNGEIAIESTPRTGTTIRMVFPGERSLALEAARAQRPSEPAAKRSLVARVCADCEA